MEVVSLTGDGAPIRAYVARPAAPGPAIVVLHSSWGLLDDYKEICNRLAKEGFLAVAPDMGAGRVASSWAQAEQFARETPSVQLVPAAVAVAGWLKAQPRLTPERVGAQPRGPERVGAQPRGPERVGAQPGLSSNRVGLLGFSRGGATALRAAAAGAGDAVVTFYGTPDPAVLEGLQVPVLGHFAETDPYEPAAAVAGLFTRPGQRAIVHPGTQHCFVETLPGTHHKEACAKAWQSAVAFLRHHLTLR